MPTKRRSKRTGENRQDDTSPISGIETPAVVTGESKEDLQSNLVNSAAEMKIVSGDYLQPADMDGIVQIKTEANASQSNDRKRMPQIKVEVVKRLACPFFKRFPSMRQRHRICGSTGWSTISGVK
jgi:hypothetical protein